MWNDHPHLQFGTAGLPFGVELPQYKPEVLEAMEEAKRISKDPNTKRFGGFSDALEDIE